VTVIEEDSPPRRVLAARSDSAMIRPSTTALQVRVRERKMGRTRRKMRVTWRVDASQQVVWSWPKRGDGGYRELIDGRVARFLYPPPDHICRKSGGRIFRSESLQEGRRP